MQIKKKKAPMESAKTGQVGPDMPIAKKSKSNPQASATMGMSPSLSAKMGVPNKGISAAQEVEKLEGEVTLGPTRTKYMDKIRKRAK